ncbi:HAD family hydrolase [Evansella cellulosilytica]|uniref:Haloacid dehalogenase domain protein hydrolase n=1 Tax=Evansella cellulosilytica (strain ATCC 21833 / DSM 2522 / FERM P-1141 / JCM 9156 / N-4) TaxID=649639 RepID=E6TYR8_EVAC2|nr:HAD family hydrolase [Evansella cellulosilytica]ADU31253.1 Haloacid dehalogenase domain protein hydrolase [Evansella cellulosilytica DSM 2522]
MENKLFIFDLDGTLYEGTDHFDYYAERLKLDVPPENLEAFVRDYELMKAGKHPVAIGKAYDTKNDAILTVDPMTLTVVKAEDWNGNRVTEVEKQYGEKQITFDFKNIIAIGDGWWLPCACALHHGVDECYPRYVETKDYMVTDQFQLEKIKGLTTFLKNLREKASIVLLTNSDEDDVSRLLSELDLEGIFHEVLTSAQKPTKTTSFFEQLLEKYDVSPKETVSVGDNFINEIAPALLMGMNAVYISEHSHEAEHEQLVQVNRLHEWMELMK